MSKQGKYLSNLQLKNELERCLNCKEAPCADGCPLHLSPREFIAFAKQGNMQAAVNVIRSKNPLGLVCGLVCPSQFCMKNCLRGRIDCAIKIPQVQAVLAQNVSNIPANDFAANGRKIAVVGGGPAGMAAAWALQNQGCEVELFESSDKIGGALNLIPEVRLPREAIERDWQEVIDIGHIKVHYHSRVDDASRLLDSGFDGVIIAIGVAEVPMNIKGEDNMITYSDYLHSPQKYKNAQNVGIIGGGKVAADCALCASLNGANEVILFVRRRMQDMRMPTEDLAEILAYGVKIMPLTRVTEVQKGDNSLICTTCSTTVQDGQCQDVKNSEVEREGFDLLIKATGGGKKNLQDSNKIIAAGDCKNGSTTVVEAVVSGIEAAKKLLVALG